MNIAMEFSNMIMEYFAKRGLKYPDFDDAMKFAITEIAEVFEIELSQREYVRNNPESKPKYDEDKLEEELGDVLMMIQIAGMVKGLNPLGGLLRKIERKLGGQ